MRMYEADALTDSMKARFEAAGDKPRAGTGSPTARPRCGRSEPDEV